MIYKITIIRLNQEIFCIFRKTTQFENHRKLGDDELISLFEQRLESSIEEKFQSFVQANNDRKVFIVSISICNTAILNSRQSFVSLTFE